MLGSVIAVSYLCERLVAGVGAGTRARTPVDVWPMYAVPDQRGEATTWNDV
jgi:hypothetical protein